MTRLAAALAALLLPATALAGEVTATIPVGGMHCDSCVNSVQEALQKVEGVRSVKVNEKGEAIVTYDDGKVNAKRLQSVIAAAGFKPGALALH